MHQNFEKMIDRRMRIKLLAWLVLSICLLTPFNAVAQGTGGSKKSVNPDKTLYDKKRRKDNKNRQKQRPTTPRVQTEESLAASQQIDSIAIPVDNLRVAAEMTKKGHIARQKKDYVEAFEWWSKAAELENSGAQFELGRLYEAGLGVEQNYSKAVEWYLKAANQGEVLAQCNLGYMFENGLGVPQDYYDAVKWYRKAAEQGEPMSQYNLGNMYLHGNGVSKDYNEALKWYRKAADQDYAGAQCALGYMYRNGYGVQENAREAVNWYRKAAEQGDAQGQTNLGSMYMYGQGESKNPTEAIKWYRKAADQGYAAAQFCIGECYRFGEGVAQNIAEACYWYEKAAEQGDEVAEGLLAQMRNQNRTVISVHARGHKYGVVGATVEHFRNGKKLESVPTDLDGNCSLTDLQKDDKILISYIGHKRKEITVSNPSPNSVKVVIHSGSSDKIERTTL